MRVCTVDEVKQALHVFANEAREHEERVAQLKRSAAALLKAAATAQEELAKQDKLGAGGGAADAASDKEAAPGWLPGEVAVALGWASVMNAEGWCDTRGYCL